MDSPPHRIDALNWLAADDELPDYDEAATAPEYSIGNTATPLQTYHMRQMDRKLQLFVPYGPSTSSSYRVAARSAWLFSKKAETNIWRTIPGSETEEHIAGIWFDHDGPLPWCPRAHFSYQNAVGLSMHGMEARNFSDWSIALGRWKCMWTLEGHPEYKMALRLLSTDEVIAHFNFSAKGTAALGGAEAGGLTIYRHAMTTEDNGDSVVEMILCGLVVALANFRKMGKYYKSFA